MGKLNEKMIVEFYLKEKYLLKMKAEYYCLRVSLWNKPFVVDIWNMQNSLLFSWVGWMI